MSSPEQPVGVSPQEIAKLLSDESLPSPIAAALRAGMALERIELDAEGRFWHQGEPFENERLSQLFHRSIARTPGGTYLISIPPYSYPFHVADAPRQVRHIRIEQAAVMLLLGDDSEQPLDPSSLRYVPSRGLYCLVLAPDAQRWPARFLRPAYYELLSHIEEADGQYELDLLGQRWPISVGTEPPR